MKKRILLLLLLVATGIILLNYGTIQDYASDFLRTQIATWGYIGIFFTTLIIEMIPQPFFSALILYTTGIFFELDPLFLLFIMILGGVIGNYGAYFVGKQYNTEITRFFVSGRNYHKTMQWFERYGKKALTVLALTPLPYFPVMGGIFRLTFYEFTIYAIIPRIIHFLIFGYLITLFI